MSDLGSLLPSQPPKPGPSELAEKVHTEAAATLNHLLLNNPGITRDDFSNAVSTLNSFLEHAARLTAEHRDELGDTLPLQANVSSDRRLIRAAEPAIHDLAILTGLTIRMSHDIQQRFEATDDPQAHSIIREYTGSGLLKSVTAAAENSLHSPYFPGPYVTAIKAVELHDVAYAVRFLQQPAPQGAISRTLDRLADQVAITGEIPVMTPGDNSPTL